MITETRGGVGTQVILGSVNAARECRFRIACAWRVRNVAFDHFRAVSKRALGLTLMRSGDLFAQLSQRQLYDLPTRMAQSFIAPRVRMSPTPESTRPYLPCLLRVIKASVGKCSRRVQDPVVK